MKFSNDVYFKTIKTQDKKGVVVNPFELQEILCFRVKACKARYKWVKVYVGRINIEAILNGSVVKC